MSAKFHSSREAHTTFTHMQAFIQSRVVGWTNSWPKVDWLRRRCARKGLFVCIPGVIILLHFTRALGACPITVWHSLKGWGETLGVIDEVTVVAAQEITSILAHLIVRVGLGSAILYRAQAESAHLTDIVVFVYLLPLRTSTIAGRRIPTCRSLSPGASPLHKVSPCVIWIFRVDCE